MLFDAREEANKKISLIKTFEVMLGSLQICRISKKDKGLILCMQTMFLTLPLGVYHHHTFHLSNMLKAGKSQNSKVFSFQFSQ